MLYTLTFDGATAIADDMGGELISYTKDGIEYLWGGSPDSWTGRSPHLFPVAGVLRDNSHTVDGKTYPMGRHGFARNMPYTVVAQSENEISFQITETPETLSAYPFPFVLTVTHTFDGKGFTTQYTVENPGSEPLPFCIGGHAGFKCPLLPGEHFEDYCVRLDSPATVSAYHINSTAPLRKEDQFSLLDNSDTLPLSRKQLDDGCLLMDSPPFQEVSLVHQTSGKGVRFRFPGFPVFVLWTMEHKWGDYLCLEPWVGLPVTETDGPAIADKPYAVLLEPSETASFAYSAEIIVAQQM